MDLLEVEKLKTQALTDLDLVDSLTKLEEFRVKYFGKKGLVTVVTKDIVSLGADEKKALGRALNEVKSVIQGSMESKKLELEKSIPSQLPEFYKSLPGTRPEIGHLHVITQAIREIVDIFKPLGFTRVRYPEIDWEYFVFEALNIPEEHPARDEWETFFVDISRDEKYGRTVITPHTSSGQVREMLKGNLPIRMLNISRCGRRQADVRHLPTFYQFEGLVVDKGINISHLKGVLNYFVKNFYGPEREIRLRPYDFRFTEPSFEVDVLCSNCLGAGCSLCKEGWMELGGAGVVHPKVLEYGGIDSKEYSGFAFGWGVERTYMMKSGTQIDDIRHLFANDVRFLEQF